VSFLERFDTVWLRLSSKVAAGAMEHGKALQAQRVFCGHTHEAMQAESDGVEYFNCGSWTQQNATFITIDSTGVTIHDYEERIDDHHSSEERSETDSEFAELSSAAGLSGDLEYENISG
jgi:predicted phosphodiesterase